MESVLEARPNFNEMRFAFTVDSKYQSAAAFPL